MAVSKHRRATGRRPSFNLFQTGRHASPNLTLFLRVRPPANAQVGQPVPLPNAPDLTRPFRLASFPPSLSCRVPAPPGFLVPLRVRFDVAPPARWFTKIGHKGCEPHYYRFVLRCHSIINTECDNLPIYVRWRKGRKTGRTAVQWEENGKITWGDDKGIMMFALTLFWDAKKDAYECKPLVLSVERHMRNNKSQCMGVISLDLAEFVNMEAAIVSKKMKLDIEDGPFECGTLRFYLSSKFMPDGVGSDEDGEITADDEDGAGRQASDEEDAQDTHHQEPFVPTHRRARQRKDGAGPSRGAEVAGDQTSLPRRDLVPTEDDDERTQKRKMLLKLQDEGRLCALCQKKLPQLRCQVCKQDLCHKCDAALHADAAMATHPRDSIDVDLPEVCLQKSLKESAQARESKIKSRGMKMKVEAVQQMAQVSETDALDALKEAEWDVDCAVGIARANPRIKTQVHFAKVPIVRQMHEVPHADYNPAGERKGGLKKTKRAQQFQGDDIEEEEVLLAASSDEDAVEEEPAFKSDPHTATLGSRTLSKGDRVVVVGLVGLARLNGQTGSVCGYQHESDAGDTSVGAGWLVELDQDQQVMAFKISNLRRQNKNGGVQVKIKRVCFVCVSAGGMGCCGAASQLGIDMFHFFREQWPKTGH